MNLKNNIIDNRYEIAYRIREGGISEVYLAHDISNRDRKVIIKVLKKKYASSRIEDVIRFHSEASIASKLSHPNIVKIYGIGNINNLHYIVMEYIDGRILHDILRDGAKFEIDKTVEIALQIGRALEYIHDNGIIHRDVKPGNILLEGDGKLDAFNRLKLLDFGLAQIKEFSEIDDTDEIAGTFSYMSPEQSGVIKRNVDERSDLYSLGIMLYQMLTGQLPFKGKTITSLIHQHIAKTPESPSRYDENIPDVLGKITLRLIEKDSESRYQSAKGLLSDLERYKKGERDFILGLDDKYIRLSYRSGLVNRDEELNKLKVMFDNAMKGNGRVCLISGDAGSGKTRLAQEFRDYVSSKGGLFIGSKCFSGENKAPYGPFNDALNIYIKTFGKYSPEKQRTVREKIEEAVGDLGEIIVRLNPMMKEILGKRPPLVELEPERENERFLMTVSRFFQRLGGIENGLVLMMDDLQWSDKGSLELLNEIIHDISNYPVMVIGTYRDHEITEGRSLREFIKSADENKYPLEEIHIDLFDDKRMNKFVSGLLYEKEENTKDIADFVFRKSEGNPFFAIEILKQLVDEGAITHNNRKWVMKHKILAQIKISPSIIDIILKRISLLDEKEMNLLSYAAVIGRKFEIELLFELLVEYDKIEVIGIVDRAVKLQLLDEDIQEKGKVFFAHDRIKEAFYKSIGEEERKRLHLEIARMEEEINRENIKDVIFDLAYHYIEGGDRDKSLEYSLPAAIEAKGNYANEDAIRYFTIAKDILEEKDQKGNEKWLKCMEGIGEIYLVIGKYDEAIELFSNILSLRKTEIEKAIIYKQITEAYFKKGDFRNCEEYARKGLLLLGERLPIKRIDVIFGIIKELLIHTLHILFPRLFIRSKENLESEKYKIIISFYLSLSWSYVLSDVLKCINSVFRMFDISESNIGPSKELGMSTGGYASIYMAIPLFKRAIRYHEKALNLRKELNDEWGIAQSLQFMGYCYQWKGEYNKSIDYFNKSVDIFTKIGNIHEVGFLKIGIGESNIYIGDYTGSKNAADEHLEITKKSNDDYAKSASLICFVPYCIEIGDYEKAYHWGIQGYNLSLEKKIWFLFCEANIYLGILFLEKGEIKKSLEYLEKAKELFENNNFLKHYTILLYPYISEAYIGERLINKEKMTKAENKASLKKIKRSVRDAIRKTKSWTTYYGISQRVNAKYYALIEKNKRAEKLFLQSIDHNKNLGRRYELGKDFYEFGIFLRATGENNLAKTRWESAYRIFKEIDSRIYMQKTANLLGLKEDKPTSSERLMDRQRLSSIINVSQDISSILNLDSLLEIIMGKAVEATGAQRGYLFIYDDITKDIEIKASKGIGNDEAAEFSSHIVEDVYKSAETLITTNAENEEELADYSSVVEYGLKSILSLPIKHHEKVIGVCYLDNPLSSGVFTIEDADMLGVFMNQAAIAIENAYLYSNLEKSVEERTSELKEKTESLEIKTVELSNAYEKLDSAYADTKKDLNLARNIQNSLLPKNIGRMGRLRFHVEYLPLIEVGGDIYDIHKRDDGIIRIFLADATGHGIVASLITMLIKSEYEKLKNAIKNPLRVFNSLNRTFINTYKSLNMFFTAIIVDIDQDKERMIYSSCGHSTQYLVRGNQLVELHETGRSIAVWDDINCRSRKLKFRGEDRLLLFTDGIFEEFNINRDEYGEGRVKDIINNNISKPVKDIIDLLIIDMRRFVDGSKLNDDITIIGVE